MTETFLDHNQCSETIEGLRVAINDPSSPRDTTSEPEGEQEQPVEQIEEKPPRHGGVVKWFNPTKGFGFITPEDGGADVFVHQSEIQLGGFRSLAQGEYVEYDLVFNGEKGPKALKVTGPAGQPPKGAPRQKQVMNMVFDGDRTYFASETKKIQQYTLIGNQVPMFSPPAQVTVPYTNAPAHYVPKRNVQQYQAPNMSPKPLGFVHSPITTHGSFTFYPPQSHEIPVNYSWANSPSQKHSTQSEIAQPTHVLVIDPVAQMSPQTYHYPVAASPISPTYAGYQPNTFTYPISPTPKTQQTATDPYASLGQGIQDLSLGTPSYVTTEAGSTSI